jgi:hypothetical protein
MVTSRLAAGMAARAVAFLERANWLTWLDTVVWDSGWLLSEASIPGRALHTVIGYTDQPTQMQLSVYLAVIAITGWLMRLTARVRGGHAVEAVRAGRLNRSVCERSRLGARADAIRNSESAIRRRASRYGTA